MGGCVASTSAFLVDMQNSSNGFTGDFKLDWDYQRATIIAQLDVTWRKGDEKKGAWKGIPEGKKALLMALQRRAENPDWERPGDNMIEIYKQAYELFSSDPISSLESKAAKKQFLAEMKAIEPRWARLYYDATESFAGLGEMCVREYTEAEKQGAVEVGRSVGQELASQAATMVEKFTGGVVTRDYNPNKKPEGLVYKGVGKEYWARGCQPKFWKTFPYHKNMNKTLGEEMNQFAHKLKKWKYEATTDEKTLEWRSKDGIKTGDEIYPDWIKHFRYVTEEKSAPATEEQKKMKRNHGWTGRTEKHHEGWTLQDFVNHPCCKSQGLIEEEVAAIRLYTGEGFGAIGGVLRGAAEHVGIRCEDLTIFATCIMSACTKLSNLYTPAGYLYRGMGCALNYGIYTKMVELEKQRVEMVAETKGTYWELWSAIDLCMLESSVGSTTPDIRIASSFSKYVHKFKEGKCTNSGCSEEEANPSAKPADVLCLVGDTVLSQMLLGYCKAARIDFLSQYTEQREYIMPPLTVFKTKSAVLYGKAVVLTTETKFPDIMEKPLPERFRRQATGPA